MKKGTIICYGDSNTYGYDPRVGSDGRYEKNVRWTGILEHELEVKLENHGICGRCIPHTEGQIRFAREQVLGWQSLEEPVWLWIMLGTNDLLQEKSFKAGDTAARMEAFLRQLMEEPAVSSGKIHLLLIAPPRMQHGTWVHEERIFEESARLGREFQKVARELGVSFVDAGKWDVPVRFDGVHLSEEGHRNFAKSLLAEWEQI